MILPYSYYLPSKNKKYLDCEIPSFSAKSSYFEAIKENIQEHERKMIELVASLCPTNAINLSSKFSINKDLCQPCQWCVYLERIDLVRRCQVET